MVEMKMHVPDTLAPKLKRMNRWLPIVLELSLAGFKTATAQTVAEVIDFLAKGPAPKRVAAYKVSARAQMRLRRLLALNASGLLSEDEQRELDEIETLEHLMVMLKMHAHEQAPGKSK
jgi:hypothetical protein